MKDACVDWYLTSRLMLDNVAISLSAIDCLSPTKTYGGGEAFAWVNPTFLGKSFVNACTLKI